jgi:hypothetical protein
VDKVPVAYVDVSCSHTGNHTHKRDTVGLRNAGFQPNFDADDFRRNNTFVYMPYVTALNNLRNK